MNTFERLAQTTYVLEHNPNCPKPYMVRLPRYGVIDRAPSMRTRDILGYGNTLEEAASEAFALKDEQMQERRPAHG